MIGQRLHPLPSWRSSRRERENAALMLASFAVVYAGIALAIAAGIKTRPIHLDQH